MVLPGADEGEVRCKSVATIITVTEANVLLKSEYPPCNAKVLTFLDMKSVAVLRRVYG